jgi:hypothetical protein
VTFATKPKIGIAMVAAALDAGIPCAWVLGDSVYGSDNSLRVMLDWTFRRTSLARIPPPRHAEHRRLRISGLRGGEDSPFRTLLRPSVRKTCRSRT